MKGSFSLLRYSLYLQASADQFALAFELILLAYLLLEVGDTN